MAFQSAHTPLQLIDQVREVSLTVSAQQPELVTQAEWNSARAKAGHPDAVKAHAICQRLGLKWSQLLRIAHRDRSDALRSLEHALADKGRKGWTVQDIAYALRQVSVRLNATTLTRSEYTAGREQILARSRSTPYRHVAERSIPSLSQIETVLDQNQMRWEDALTSAGLDPPTRRLPTGLTELDAARMFATQTGLLPAGVRQLRRWAHENLISIVVPQQARLDRALTELRRERKKAGLPPLKRAAPGPTPPSIATLPQQTLPARHFSRWTRETIIPGLARAVQLLGTSRQLSQRSLKRIAAEHPHEHIPSWTSVYNALQAHPGETWDDWRREAEQQASQAGAGPPGTH